jgi:peptidoglycan/LPS O-acetylase OafA/YrhL
MTASTTQSSDRLPYLPGLDGLRAYAVIAVILYHAAFGFIRGGFLGVEVFFVISGFLITSLLLLERERTGTTDLREFWTRRARRLLPALFVVLALVVSAAMLFAQDALVRLGEDVAAALTYSSNWVMILRQESYFEAFARPPLLRHLWSLAIEEQFYLLWPLLFAGGALLFADEQRRRMLRLVLTAVVASTALMWWLYVPYDDPSRVYFGTDTRAAGILVGIALAFIWRPGRLPRLRPATTFGMNLLGVFALAGLTVLLLQLGEYDPALYQGGFLVVSLLTAMVIAVTVHPQGALSPVLGIGLLVWVGKRSYGLYLYHWPVFMLLRPEVDVAGGRWPTLAVQLALTVAIAEASYRWIEQPIRQQGFKAWAGEITRAPVRRDRHGWVVWPAVAAAFVIGVTFGSVQVSSAPPPEVAIAASPVQAEPSLEPIPQPVIEQAEDGTGFAVTWSAAAEDRDPAPRTGQAATRGPPLLIGDSVMVGAIPELVEAFDGIVDINAVTSRQMKDVPDLITEIGADQPVGGLVLIHLGTNGTFSPDQFDEVMRSLSHAKAVYFVNAKMPRRWQDPVNAALTAGVARWERANLIDWYGASIGHREYFVRDGVHLSHRGEVAYAELLAARVPGL